MSYILFACQAILALILLLASVSKTLYHEQFLGVLLMSNIPHVLVKPLTVLVPISEMCLAFGLVSSS
jgi:hypothetical protein